MRGKSGLRTPTNNELTDFNRFFIWCSDMGLITVTPTNTVVAGLKAGYFRDFKGFFNLCKLFLKEDSEKQKEYNQKVHEQKEYEKEEMR